MSTPILFLEPQSGKKTNTSPDEAIEIAFHLISTLRNLKKTNPKISLNSTINLAKIEISKNHTLTNILTGNRYRDEWRFLKAAALKSPISDNLDDWIEKAELLEVKTNSGLHASALLWASLCGTATVSLYADPEWKNEWISANCQTLEEDGNITSLIKNIRNVSLSDHVNIHKPWVEGLGHSHNVDDFWRDREDNFKGIRFLPSVKRQLIEIYFTGAPYSQALETLKILNEDSLRWSGKGAVEFSSKVADGEHDKRRLLVSFFDEIKNADRDFGKHAYFTGGIQGRIHFCIDAEEKKFIVAYVGKKLF